MIRIYERTSLTRHAFSSISADSTGGGELDLLSGVAVGDKFHSGVLRGMAVSCDSTDFDVSLRTKSNGQVNSLDEIYRVENINQYRKDTGLEIGWMNGDSPLKGSLYLVLTNNDGANATGVVNAEVHTDIPKRFAKYN